jgi:hypothetical protein
MLLALAACERWPSESELHAIGSKCGYLYFDVTFDDYDDGNQSPVQYHFDSDEVNLEEKRECLYRELESSGIEIPLGLGQLKANRLEREKLGHTESPMPADAPPPPTIILEDDRN